MQVIDTKTVQSLKQIGKKLNKQFYFKVILDLFYATVRGFDRRDTVVS